MAQDSPQDHPHSREESLWLVIARAIANGPSPLRWGMHSSSIDRLAIVRTILTWVRTSTGINLTTSTDTDHPHVYREYPGDTFALKMHAGPSLCL